VAAYSVVKAIRAHEQKRLVKADTFTKAVDAIDKIDSPMNASEKTMNTAPPTAQDQARRLIIGMTWTMDDDTVRLSKDAGVDSLMKKPFDMFAFSESVRECTEAAKV
jgi:hypothetical protein